MRQFFYEHLLKPRSKDEDSKRREFILNVILLGCVILSLIAFVIVLVDFMRLGAATYSQRGVPPIVMFIIFAISFILFLLSRVGFFNISAYVFLGIYLAAVIYTVYIYGVSIPQGLLTFALIIIMSSILVSTRFALGVTLIISFVIFILTYLQANLIIQPNLYWQNEQTKIDDTIVYIATFFVIMIVCWLSHREIERSLKRARWSEAALKKERDLLEVKVEERTKELKKLQMEKMGQLYRSAEFGRLSSGIFHDLINPLSAVCLSLEQIKNIDSGVLATTKAHLTRALSAAKRIENFIITVRKQIATREHETYFSLTQEINQLIPLLSYQAKKAGIKIIFEHQVDIRTFGDPLKFNQVVINLLANALDAYENFVQFDKTKKILLKTIFKNGMIHLIVQDWGSGIAEANLNKIFEPFFSTKAPGKDLGIGLAIAKNIVEKDFGGKIVVKSKQGQGASFIIEFPQRLRPAS